jgi:AAA family ATP:ADP antiporter
MLNMFVLLMAYYIVKPVREALLLGGFGAEIKAYAGAGQALLFMLLLPLYGTVASRVSRIKLINGVTAFFISNLVLFYFLALLEVNLGIVFFLWVGIFNLMLVAQFWAFANDLYTEKQGKRLFATVGVGSALGAIIGAKLAGLLFEPFGPSNLMLLTATLLGACMVLTNWIHQREKHRATEESSNQTHADQPLEEKGAFELIHRHRYLTLIAAMVLMTNFVNTTGEFILGKMVTKAAAAAAMDPANGGLTHEEYIGKFYSDFFFWVNIMTAGFQLFVVSRIMKYVGPKAALFLSPVIAFGGYMLMAFLPVLSLVRTAKILENSSSYSIQNTAHHALFLHTSREAKYKASTAIDSFFWRIGDATSALLVFVGTRLAFDSSNYAMVNVVVVILWLMVVLGLSRFRHRGSPAIPRVA